MIKRNKKTWIVKEADLDDFDAIRRLFRAVWGYQRPLEYDKWKYLKFVEGVSQISVAKVNDEIVSAFMLAPITLSIGSEIVPGGVAMDVMSHPEYVGTTSFIEVGKHCVIKAQERGLRVLYGFPNTHSFPSFVKRLNWDHSGNINHWVRPIKPSIYSKVPLILGPVADLAFYLLPTGKIGDLTIKVSNYSENEILQLLKGQKKFAKKCGICHNENWYFSRYVGESRSSYEWVYAYQGGKVVACGVWGMRDKSWGGGFTARAQITELFGNEVVALSGILSTIIKRARKKDAMLLETVTNDPRLEKVLKRCSFYKYNQIPLIVKNIGKEELSANIHHHPNWTIFGGDVDTF